MSSPSPFAPVTAPTADARRRAVVGGATTRRHTLPYTAAWTGLMHPDTWRIVEDAAGRSHLLPGVLKLHHVSGTLGVGVGRTSDGRPAPVVDGAVIAARERGMISLPDGPVLAFGQAMPDYCCRYEGERTVAHLWAWQRPRVLHRRSNVETDLDAKVAAIRGWMQDLFGVEQAPAEIVESHRDGLIRRERILAVEAGRNPRRIDELALVRRRLDSLGWAPATTVHVAAQPAPPDIAALLADPAIVAQLRAALAAPAPPAPDAPPVSSGDGGEDGALPTPAPRPLRRS
jgi:hypothetical protein